MEGQAAADFTPDGWRTTLETALENGYAFIPFEEEAVGGFAEGDRCCLLRHDIDADVGAALQMAQAEAELGIRATYFFTLRSPLYNLLGRANHLMAEEILELGHWLGLHFDGAFLRRDRSLHDAVLMEQRVLADLFARDVRAVSFHQPTPNVLEAASGLPGLVNTYDRTALAGFHYLSDSNRHWREGPARDAFARGEHRRIQLLVHPLWWTKADPDLTTEDLWDLAVARNFERTQRQMLETERAYGPERRMLLERDGVRAVAETG